MKLFGVSLSALVLLSGSSVGLPPPPREEGEVRRFNTPFVSCGSDPSGKGSCLVLDKSVYQSLLEMPVDTLVEFNQFQTQRNVRSILRLKRFSASDNGDDLDKVVLLRGAAFEDDSYFASSEDYISSFEMKPTRTAFIALSPYGSNGMIEIMNSTFVLSTPDEPKPLEGEEKIDGVESDYVSSLRSQAHRYLPHIKNTLKDFNMNQVSVIFDSVILDRPAVPYTDHILPPPPTDDNGEDVEGPSTSEDFIKTFKIATDVDFALFQKKGSTSSASSYYYTLIGHSASIYRRDFGHDFSSSYLKIYDKQDPYPTTGGASACLNYMQKNWSTSTPARSMAALLSGKSLGGGIAYLKTLCNKSYAYAVNGNMVGSYPVPVRSFDKGNWDIYVFLHEVGHVWGAQHTHDLGVDKCNVSCGPTKGTIMSYCHTCSGGMTNIDLVFHQRNKDQVKAFVNTLTC